MPNGRVLATKIVDDFNERDRVREGFGYKNACKTEGFWLQKSMQNGRVLATKMMDDVNEKDRVGVQSATKIHAKRKGFGYKNDG